MRKLRSICVLLGILSSLTIGVNAQCSGIRYHNYLFTDSVRSEIIYGLNKDYEGRADTLKLDMYFPKSDPTPVNRPLIIWAHAGYFLEGDKADLDVTPLCHAFAKMGYVVASINYRLGMENYPGPNHDSLSSMRAVIRGMQDARAAVRFFKNSTTTVTGNPYGIDSSNIFFGGTSTGAMVALHLAYLTQPSMLPAWCDTTKPGMSGGLYGNSGTQSYSFTTLPVPSNIKAVISICGAITDTSWMMPGSVPVICFHGDSDKTIPYRRARLMMNGDTLQTVNGGYSIMLRANHLGMTNCFKEYIRQDQLPEVNPLGNGPLYLDTTMNLVRNFLATFVCGDAQACNYQNPLNGISNYELSQAEIHCYPNPAGRMLTIDLGEFHGEPATLTLFNNMGQVVRTCEGIHDSRFSLERGGLPSGLYLVSVVVKGKRFVSRVVFE
jgi:para-nitrobenzyl esterase